MEGYVATWLDQAKKNAGWLIFFGVVEIIAGIVAIISQAKRPKIDPELPFAASN